MKVSTITVSVGDEDLVEDSNNSEESYYGDAGVHSARIERGTVLDRWQDKARTTLKKRSTWEAKLATLRTHSNKGWKQVTADDEMAMDLQVEEHAGATATQLHTLPPKIQDGRKLRARTTQSWLQEQLAIDSDPQRHLERALKGSKVEISA